MGPWVWVRSSNKRLNRSVLYVGDVMTDLIKRDDALAAIDTFKRDFEQSWKVQFSADIKALPAIDLAAIPALQARIEELEKQCSAYARSDQFLVEEIKELEAKLTKAVEALRFYTHDYVFSGSKARNTLAELEGK